MTIQHACAPRSCDSLVLLSHVLIGDEKDASPAALLRVQLIKDEGSYIHPWRPSGTSLPLPGVNAPGTAMIPASVLRLWITITA